MFLFKELKIGEKKQIRIYIYSSDLIIYPI